MDALRDIELVYCLLLGIEKCWEDEKLMKPIIVIKIVRVVEVSSIRIFIFF